MVAHLTTVGRRSIVVLDEGHVEKARSRLLLDAAAGTDLERQMLEASGAVWARCSQRELGRMTPRLWASCGRSPHRASLGGAARPRSVFCTWSAGAVGSGLDQYVAAHDPPGRMVVLVVQPHHRREFASYYGRYFACWWRSGASRISGQPPSASQRRDGFTTTRVVAGLARHRRRRR